jgi:hypothetical protein
MRVMLFPPPCRVNAEHNVSPEPSMIVALLSCFVSVSVKGVVSHKTRLTESQSQ